MRFWQNFVPSCFWALERKCVESHVRKLWLARHFVLLCDGIKIIISIKKDWFCKFCTLLFSGTRRQLGWVTCSKALISEYYYGSRSKLINLETLNRCWVNFVYSYFQAREVCWTRSHVQEIQIVDHFKVTMATNILQNQ